MKSKNKTIYITLILLAIISLAVILLIALIKTRDISDAAENRAENTEEIKTILLEPEEILTEKEKDTAINDSGRNEVSDPEKTDTDNSKTENSDSDEPKTENSDFDAPKTENSDSDVPETENTDTEDSNTENSETKADTQVQSEETDKDVNRDWVESLPAARNEKQIMVVAATGSSAGLSLHNREADGSWKEVFRTNASIGKNGIGKTKEGDHKTPRGSYRFTMGFGLKQPANVNLPYTQVDGNCFWVDDPASKYYNRFVNLNNAEKDWNSAESLAGSGKSYNYALAINYNEACVPGKGSAIFLHCLPTGGAGCIAVSEDAMERLLKEISPGCLLLIDYASELGME